MHMKTALEYYEIFPKLLPADRESTLMIYPRGKHAQFEKGKKYVITVRALLECEGERKHRYVKYVQFLLEDYFPRHDELCYEEGRLMKETLLGSLEAKEMLSTIKHRTAAYLDRCYNG